MQIIVNAQTGERTVVAPTAEEEEFYQAEQSDFQANDLPKFRKQQRAAAYAQEADPLFFKAQRGEATTAEWEAKVAEIKARFPYPGDNE